MPDQAGIRKTLIRSCEFCRTRKVRCDGHRPFCKTCCDHGRECVYQITSPKPRPTKAVINTLRSENKRLLSLIQRLESATTPEKLWRALHSGKDRVSSTPQQRNPMSPGHGDDKGIADNREESNAKAHEPGLAQPVPHQPIFDTSSYISVDESGDLNSFGPSSAWQTIPLTLSSSQNAATANTQNALVANAALSRQLESRLATLRDLDGVPMDLATHLLELHWNRQHHTFLLTYRPAIIRDLLNGGEFGSKFLLNSIFACASKFSTKSELRETFGNSKAAGSRFFQRCDELITQENLLLQPSLATIAGLLLLGSTYVARGITTKGWLLTGYALRMVYDLGLHIDRKTPDDKVIEEEARKRIFWGAFVCDKLQSLYLGRPFAIKLRDAHVSLEFNDIMEENELWTPYEDLSASGGKRFGPQYPTYSVSCFRRLCLLSKIMTRIIDEFYVVGATVESAQSSLRSIDDLLKEWEENLPDGLRINSPSHSSIVSHAPNVLCLHIIYHALKILLHRPLVADTHLRSASPPETSWKQCSEAAEKITGIVARYRQLYTLRGAPYLVSYGLYVACTIHARNIDVNANEMMNECRVTLERSFHWLEELAIPNPAVAKTISIIKKLMSARGVTLDLIHENIEIPAEMELASTEEDRVGDIVSNTLDTDADAGLLSMENLFFNEWNETFSDDLLYGFMEQDSFDELIH